MSPIAWRCDPFGELSPAELYELLALRQRVFVVEQRCAYLDADGWDAAAWHLAGRDAEQRLIAYARLFGPGVRYPGAAAIGRVASAPEVRGRGVGRALMAESLRRVEERWGRATPVKLQAQSYLLRFYRELGFEPVSEEYDEDGIPHLDMVRPGGR